MKTFTLALFAGAACAHYIKHGGLMVQNNCANDIEARSVDGEQLIERVPAGETSWRSFPPVGQPIMERYFVPGEETDDVGALFLNQGNEKLNFVVRGDDYHLGFLDEAGYLDGCIDIWCPQYESSNGTGVIPIMGCEYGLAPKCVGKRPSVIQTVTFIMIMCPSQRDKEVTEQLSQIEEEHLQKMKPVLDYLTTLAAEEGWTEIKQRQLMSAIVLAMTQHDYQLMNTLIDLKDVMDTLEGDDKLQRSRELMYSMTEQQERNTKEQSSSGKAVSVLSSRSTELAPRFLVEAVPLVGVIIGAVTFVAVIASLYEGSLMAARTS